MVIAIIDYGLGNLKSIKNMFDYINVKSIITNNYDHILSADKIVLPGVGSFDAGMMSLKSTHLFSLLNDLVVDKRKKILGICLGMQLMTLKSDEGKELGFGWFDAKTVRFDFRDNVGLKVPHMGWNYVMPFGESSLFNGLSSKSRFYFVHSYYVDCADEDNILAKCSYGNDFACAIVKDNIFGVQFHPEKSHKFGMTLLKNFAEL